MNKLLRNWLKCIFILVALLFLMQGVAQAHLYGVSYGQPDRLSLDSLCTLSMLFVIDPDTGYRTEIGDIIGESNSDNTIGYWGVAGIDFHPQTGELFAVGYRCLDPNMNTPYLLTLNPFTGFVTNEQEIDISELESDFQRFTDISFQSNGTLFAFYLFTNIDGHPEGAVATIDLEDGDAEAVGEGTGSVNIQGGGIAFLYGDPNNGTLYQAESTISPILPFEALLNVLDPADGDIEDSQDLEFHSPIAGGDRPTIDAMDSQPGTGILYAAITFCPYTEITGTPERWFCGNYLATVDEGTGNVNVIGCLSDPYGGMTCYEPLQVKAIAFAPSVTVSVTATPNTLFPTMCGLLHEVTVNVEATDISDSAPTYKIISVSSNQEGCRWLREPDWFITGPDTVLLRAKKDMFSLDNRIYTITVEYTDVFGSISTASTTVEVGYRLDDGFLPDFEFPEFPIRSDSRDRRFLSRSRRR